MHCEIDADTTKTELEVFRAFSAPDRPGIQRSRVRVALFEHGTDFVSRTEAELWPAELEAFGEVEVDFTGVGQVGQGFVDELFRVWQAAHPETRLLPTNTNPAIDALLRIALGS
ncbi:MAG: STAS-like domain-containing protein [Acidimicrobiales bacterium]